MTRIAYLDVIGGISGDMLLAAILDAGVSETQLAGELSALIPEEFELRSTKTTRGSITATHVDVIAKESSPWNWDGFRSVYEDGQMKHAERDAVESVFDCLRQAESKAHGGEEPTHLHELGTVDTLVDVIGAVVGMRLLGIDSLHCSSLPGSVGVSSSSHGVSASFAPATMEIIRHNRIPIRASGSLQPVGEAVTPTGAAIIASLAQFNPVEMTIEKVGYGAGTRQSHEPPNVLGLWVGEAVDPETKLKELASDVGVTAESNTVLLETNLDDMTGEELGHVVGRIMDFGALDAWFTPIQMKKNRPGITLSALIRKTDLNRISSLIFEETTTLGVRIRGVDRLVADRETILVPTRFGPVAVKVKKLHGRIVSASPEYEECQKIASEFGMSLRDVMSSVEAQARATLNVGNEGKDAP